MASEIVGRGVVELSTDDKALNRGLDAAKGKLGKFGGLAKVALLGVAAGAVAIGGALLKIGSDFDEAFDTIRVGTGATGEALAGLKDDFRAVFAAVPTDMKSASTAIADLNTRLGLTGKPLQDLSVQFLNLARVTKTEVGPLIAATTRVFGQFNVEAERQGAALDFLFKVSQSTGVSVDILNAQLVKSGPALQEMGFSLEESAALLGTWEKEGVNSKTAIAGLTQAVGVFAREGIPAREGLADTIAKMQALGPGADATKLAVKLFGATAGPLLAQQILEGNLSVDELTATLGKSGETINGVAGETDDWTQKLEVMKNKLLIALEPAADKVFTGLGQLIDAVTPIVEQLAIWIGDNLPGAMDEAGKTAEELRPFFELLGELWGVISTHVLPVLGGALRGLVTIIAGVSSAISTLIGWARQAIGWLSQLASAVANSPVGGALGAIGNAASLVGGGFAGGFAHGGSFVTSGPTMALFGEGPNPRELVTAMPLGGSAAGAQTITVPVFLDGRQIARATSRAGYREARLRGLDIGR